jgi:hypothetical protein
MKISIEIVEKKIEKIDITSQYSVIKPETINGMVEVRFILKRIFDCTCNLQWKPEYKDDNVLEKEILAKIFNEI